MDSTRLPVAYSARPSRRMIVLNTHDRTDAVKLAEHCEDWEPIAFCKCGIDWLDESLLRHLLM